MPLSAEWEAPWHLQYIPHPHVGSQGQRWDLSYQAMPGAPLASVSLLDDRCFEVSSSQDLFLNRPTWYLNARVPVSNWLLKMATSLQKHPSPSLLGGDGRQVGARLGHEEMGAPGTAVTLCHCGQLSAPAASCPCARHETDPLSHPASTAEWRLHW